MKIKVKDLKKAVQNKLNESEKNQKVKNTQTEMTAKQFKQKLNEMKMGFGFGFANSNNVESDNLAKKPKKSPINQKKEYIGRNGAAILGMGFKLQESLKTIGKNPKKVAALVENIVKQMRGKSDYTNLKFVDNIAKKYNVNESQIKLMKGIILKENSPATAIKLYNFITECSCQQSKDIYSNYDGLQQSPSDMIPNIKRTFNKYQGVMKTPQQSINATALGLGLPMEMVEEMVELQKEAKKMKLEGNANLAETDSKLHQIYEKYQKMSEGDMFEMYDEMAEYMDYPSSDELVMDSEIYERDDYDGDEYKSTADILRDRDRQISAEPDDYWAYGKHQEPSESDEYDYNVGHNFNLDDDDEIIDMHRYDDAFDNFDDTDDYMDESFMIDEDIENRGHKISAMNPRTGEMTEYGVDVTENGYVVEGGDDVRYVQIKDDRLIGGESLPETVRQHIWDMWMNGNQQPSEMSLDDEESFNAERFNPSGQFDDWF